MFHSIGLRGLLFAGCLALGLFGVSGTAALACDPCAPHCHYEYVTTYKCVTTYVIRLEPYTKVVTVYDECGCPYKVTRTCYHEVEVPVVKKVPVIKKVLVCDD